NSTVQTFNVTAICDSCHASVMAIGLNGYFPFHGSALDQSPLAINAVVTNATLITGHDGVSNDAYHFQGTSYINAGGNNRNISNAVTIVAWVKTTETINGQWVAGKYDYYEDKGYHLAIGNSIGGGIGRVAFSGRDGSKKYHTSGHGTNPTLVNDGAWHCIVGTAGNGVWKVYVDGVLQSQSGATASTVNIAPSTAVPFTIGRHTTQYPLQMNGDIDNVLVYNRVLSAAEIVCLCGGTLPRMFECCDSPDALQHAVSSAVHISMNDSCQTSFRIGTLPECDYIQSITWPDGGQSLGVFESGDNIKYDLPPGNYVVRYNAVENNESGESCLSLELSEQVDLICECECGPYSNMFLRPGIGLTSQSLSCGGPAVFVDCPVSGNSLQLTGEFTCVGATCSGEGNSNRAGTWFLMRDAGVILSGEFTANPTFGISIPPSAYSTPGLYNLELRTRCGLDSCSCAVQFIVNCPDPCPCDLVEFQSDVDKGFAQISANNNCKACFSPIALDDCDQVSWYLTNTSGTAIGTSGGQQSFCYDFGSSGSYTLFMVVSRIKSNGSPCETFIHSKTVTVSCGDVPSCGTSLFENPGFSEGAIEGGMNTEGGQVDGWFAPFGDPWVIFESDGSQDGVSVGIMGNFNNPGILVTEERICLEKDTGHFTMRGSINRSRSNIKNISISLFTDEVILPGGCSDSSCRTLANIELTPLESTDAADTSQWFSFSIQYDISDWSQIDACDPNGISIRLAIMVSSNLSSDQGGPESLAFVEIDEICFSGTIVAVDRIDKAEPIRLYPNPTNGDITIELAHPAKDGTYIQIVSLNGQVLHKQRILTGTRKQSLNLDLLPQGMYFIKLVSKDHITSIQKFVKH
ncbi:MAG: T9SS type A sorting domain-containing protein, partial [Bacteroidota bacterium]|nr:T9SS type A sorting domain-containing protein [Bacteroidota bacterium]